MGRAARRIFEVGGGVFAVAAIGYGLVLVSNLRVLFTGGSKFTPLGLLLIVGAGVVGISGAVLYLRALRTPGATAALRRARGWVLMMVMFFLPTGLWFYFVVGGLIAVPAILVWPTPTGDR